jgi:hypothetical protein
MLIDHMLLFIYMQLFVGEYMTTICQIMWPLEWQFTLRALDQIEKMPERISQLMAEF